ncbi:hypothetical protein Ari01nite_96160 [Paractinoplanes rishiriensis]|uniref:Uncharacterized protein n=1 Tax=Paractinoplanes rishiriensis TaxID=1050105 RepID=A0A919K727_9ACTN|nr:hypothetical protein Ari01nite_96160 [Actinoplanes rishiriensis]
MAPAAASTSLAESDSEVVTDLTTVPWTTTPNQTVGFRAANDGLVLAGSSDTQADGRTGRGWLSEPNTPPPYGPSPSPERP